MIKTIQVTDMHLVKPGETFFELDPLARFSAAVDDINRCHADARLCVLTGDLVEDHDAATYKALRATVSRLSMPVRAIPGNHDRRDLLVATLDQAEQDEHGFMQSALQTEEGVFLFLDTVDAGAHSGVYCDRRIDWLRAQLDRAQGAPIRIFMHHPPFAIGLRHLDGYAMVDGDGFGQVLDAYDVRHIFFGHVHRAVSGSWRGISFSGLPSTNHQCLLDLSDNVSGVCTLEPPAYGIVLIDGDRTVVHTHQYLDRSPRYAYFPGENGEEQIRRLE